MKNPPPSDDSLLTNLTPSRQPIRLFHKCFSINLNILLKDKNLFSHRFSVLCATLVIVTF